MKNFRTLQEFERQLERMIKKYPVYEKAAGDFLAKVLEKEAKNKVGHLQDGMGGFAAWKPLAASTIQQKSKLGYVFNSDYNPLYRTGELKNSIHAKYFPIVHRIILGSSSEIMVYQEKGNKYIPPRSVIGFTMFQAGISLNYIMGGMLNDWVSDQTLKLRRKTYGSL